jgi:lycopene cyclase domain-containing protein
MFWYALGASSVFQGNKKSKDDMKFTYLLVDLFTILFPFAFSFHKKLNFVQNWRAFFPACLITAAFFVPCDILFTRLKVWGFNPDYVIGYYLINLPVEEVLFFLCIPYACLFTYHCIFKLFPPSRRLGLPNGITWILLCLSGSCIVLFPNRIYTVFTFALLIVLLILCRYVLKIDWLRRFYITYALLLIPFLIVNGILTGTGLKSPVVWYDDRQTIGIRFLTIPFEDIFYGMALILLNLLIYSFLAMGIRADTLPAKKAV